MKILKGLTAFFLLLALSVSLASCSGAMNGTDRGYSYPDAGIADSALESGGFPADGEGNGEESSETEVIPSGLLTATEWNDNKNYEYYKTLFDRGEEEEDKGKFAEHINDTWGFNALNRVSVYVENNASPVAGALAECKNADGSAVFYAKTGSDGVAYLFPDIESGTVTVKCGETVAEAAFTKEERDLKVTLEGETEAKRNKIQIMFVIDITGSMGDEHSYLKNELTDVVNRISSADDQTDIELALLFYRDSGDAEKFAYYDFTNVTAESGLSKMISNLSSHNASGGGDYPEAVDEALDLAVKKEWDEDSTTKLIFHLLDAPAHSGDSNKQIYNSAVTTAAAKGIRICPILASGADNLCEYIVRQAALYTGGSFIFITDHSGIGSEHLDPDIPNAVVEKLNDLLVRVILGYHTGSFSEPAPWNSSK